MKKARLVMSAAMLTMVGFGSALMVSCGSDDEPCPVGYEGSNCKTLSRDKFLGVWSGTDQCTTGNYDVDMDIDSSSTDKVKILIDNAGGFDVVVTGTITSSNVATVTNADVGGQRKLSGTFTVNGNALSTDYTVTPAVGVADDCTGTFTRQ